MKKKNGRLSARCIVSDRWLSFPSVTTSELSDGTPLTINVMTRSKNDAPKKICELIILKEEIEETLKSIKHYPEKQDV